MAVGLRLKLLNEPVTAPFVDAAVAFAQLVGALSILDSFMKKSLRLRYRSSGKSKGINVLACTTREPMAAALSVFVSILAPERISAFDLLVYDATRIESAPA